MSKPNRIIKFKTRYISTNVQACYDKGTSFASVVWPVLICFSLSRASPILKEIYSGTCI